MTSGDSERRYYVFYPQPDDDAAVITDFPEGPQSFEFARGEPVASEVAAGATVRFSDRYPGRQLRDFQQNTLSAVIASAHARAVIQSLEIGPVEFIPVAVLDHRGKVAASDYAIVNLLGCQPAIDMKKSALSMSTLIPTRVARIKRLVLDREAISEDAKMFRCEHALRTFIIREDVKEAFEAARLTGFKAADADGWNGLEL